jgi:hypothetical protein
MISLAISLLVVVISLTGVALAASAPTVSTLTRYIPGFSGAPGKIARDEAGNFYVADFWGKGIMKLDRNGVKSGFIPTSSRPSAVAVKSDNRLIVAMQAPEAYVAFYSQSGNAPNVTGSEIAGSRLTGHLKPFYRPVAITIDVNGYIYVLDSGDLSKSATERLGCVRVYDSAGTYKTVFGVRTNDNGAPDMSPAGDFQFKQPMGIAYEKAANQIIVADSMNGRVQFYNAYVNGVGCTFVKTVGTKTGKDLSPATGVPVRLTDPQDIALEYNASNVLDRIYLSEKALDEIVVVDAAGTCDSGKLCDNLELKRLNATTVTSGGMKYPLGIFFEKTVTGAGVLYAANAAGSTSEANVIAFKIDNGQLASTVDLQITPVAPTVTSSTLPVGGTVSPAYDVYCSLNGGSYSMASRNGGNWNMSFTTLVNNQNNWITCKSSDSLNTSYKQVNTYYTTGPGTLALAITSPVEGSTSYTKNSSVLLTGTSTGATIAIPGSTCAPVDAAGNWSCSVTLAAGSNTLNVTAAKQGYNSETRSVTVVKDTTAPGVVVSALSEAAVTNDAIQNIDGIVSDTSPISVIVVNGVVVPAYAKITTGTDTYFSAPVTLVRGSNEVTVQATDAAGNLTLATSTMVLNPEIPGLTVAVPADNSYMTGVSSASGSGSVDSSFDEVNAAGSVVTPSAGAWVTTSDFTVNSGFGTYRFVASGVGNTTIEAKRTILNDSGYAKLAITSPPADMATKNSSIVVEGYVAAASADLTVSIDGGNGVTVTPNSGTGHFSTTVNLGSEGTHVVKVATASGTSAVRNIIYDNTAPVLGIQADSRSMPPMISGSIEGSSKISAITASLSGVNVPIPMSAVTFGSYNSATDTVVWHANLSSYAYDTISFTTTDPAGNDKMRVRTASIPKGDIDKDGYVKLSDALAALRHSAGTGILVGNDFIEGDVGSLVDGRVSSDGEVNVIDAVLILRKAYGLITF